LGGHGYDFCFDIDIYMDMDGIPLGLILWVESGDDNEHYRHVGAICIYELRYLPWTDRFT
jgi:hypothetical protein